MKAILDSIRIRLAANTINSSLAGRIYLDSGPHDAALPLLVYRVTQANVEQFMGGVAKHSLLIDFQVFYDNAGTTDIHARMEEIQTALASELKPTGFDRAVMVRQTRGTPAFMDDAWSITDQYRCTAFAVT
jgi:hypothetical protein